MRRTLEHNRDKDFVRRILQPDAFPNISDDPRLQPGESASHQMSWQTMESGPLKGQHIAYPNIFYDRPTGKLVWPKPNEAIKRAVETGEYIAFPTAEHADMFSRKYKRGSTLGKR